MAMRAINPATGEIIKDYPELSLEQAETIIEELHRAFLHWKETDFALRARHLKNAAAILRKKAPDYGRLMSVEMGKPIREGQAEAEKCALACDFYADHAEKFLQKEAIETEAKKSLICYEPLGVVLAIMPWNFPFWQVFRFAAPALMAGNVGALKHASNVPGCALAIEEIFHEAGFPDNVFRTLLIKGSLAEQLIENPTIRAVTLTGSTEAGKMIAARAGKCIKKTVLELGGSDAYVILEDADVEQAATICAKARLINSGQSCIAAKRFIVVEAIRKQFEDLFVKKMRAFKMGDPLSEDVQIGPLARIDLRDQLHGQVQKSLAKGAICLLGGRIPEGKGNYYPPTVLTHVTKGMPAYEEELFGPVAAIISARDETEAIQIANDSPYGLGAAVFTRDLKKGEDIAIRKIEAGSCFVNAQVYSDPRLPFGGIKESGYGRELSYVGIKEFVNIKTIVINP
ncbi:NAD-dependent succinate-semialdehyde dehydrogenase [Candidatus Protochlamydia phocaeensis]|uniref:NAD-dependent succinate-semialdehyde dehydrogenase n=1 Tax=Candidatus Protochlamydia phocaeensis TaxID=1414722 RepID=UPI000837AB4C|nr:NAD-dependent succinate-semialdehyde dehydrogenase [Candidatus Protochlamydia phocaeensis]